MDAESVPVPVVLSGEWTEPREVSIRKTEKKYQRWSDRLVLRKKKE